MKQFVKVGSYPSETGKPLDPAEAVLGWAEKQPRGFFGVSDAKYKSLMKNRDIIRGYSTYLQAQKDNLTQFTKKVKCAEDTITEALLRYPKLNNQVSQAWESIKNALEHKICLEDRAIEEQTCLANEAVKKNEESYEPLIQAVAAAKRAENVANRILKTPRNRLTPEFRELRRHLRDVAQHGELLKAVPVGFSADVCVTQTKSCNVIASAMKGWVRK